MARFIISLIILIFSTTVSAGNLPDWFKPKAKEVVVDSFIEIMKNYSEFYRITEIIVTEGNLTSGQPAAFIDIKFDDSKACKDRSYSGQCTPFNNGKEDYVFCIEVLIDCETSTHISRTKSYQR